jgi:hypothetical protein
MSFAVRYAEAMMCINPRCKMHNIRRKVCSSCSKASQIHFKDAEICINRSCPTNATIIDSCFFCENKSFLRRKDLMFCTKGDCSVLLDEARMCAFCQQRSFLLRTSSCQNRECEMFNLRVEACPKCGQRTAVADPDDPGNLTCKSEQCVAMAATDAAEMTLDFIDLSQIEEEAASQPEAVGDDEATQLHSPPSPAAQEAHADETSGEGGTVVYQRPGTAPDIPAPPPPPEPQPTPEMPTPMIEPEEPILNPAEDHEEILVVKGAADDPPPSPDPIPPKNSTPPPPEPVPDPAEDDNDEDEEEVLVVRKKRTGPGRFQRPKTRPAEPKPAPKPAPTPAAKPVPAPAPPAPAPVHANPTHPRPAGGSAFATSPVMRVFRFLKENVLQDAQGQSYPLYLVIGLGGSGKTIYLTMLGDILLRREKSYYFPYKGIGIEPVLVEAVLRSDPEKFRAEYGSDLAQDLGKVKDLVHEFSSEIFQTFITKNLWAQHTPLEEDSTYFLITEITRNERTIAKIATVETSGEAFESIIRGMRAGRLDAKGTNAIETVLNEMLDLAEGFVILIDPSRENNDEIYRNLFLALRQGIEPRAMNKFYREVKAALAGQTKGKNGVIGLVGRYMQDQQDQAKLKAGIQEKAEMLKSRLEEVQAKFEDEEADFRAVYAEEEDFLGTFIEESRECFPQEYENAQKWLAGKESDVKVFRNYFLQWIRLAVTKVEEFAQFVYVQEQMKNEADAVAAQQSFEQKKAAAHKIQREYGIDIKIDIEEALPDDREVTRFKNLKYIAVAVTKSDMYPIIFPPEKYPQKKLTVCSSYLKELENFLKFLGGKVKYYNTSATGYSVLQGTQFVPGHENTLTPINVIEPIFDMLNL